jgi:hypothetical protein
MRSVPGTASNGASKVVSPRKSVSTPSQMKASTSSKINGHIKGDIREERERQDDVNITEGRKGRVGVLPLIEGALDIGDDGRAMVWLDIGE